MKLLVATENFPRFLLCPSSYQGIRSSRREFHTRAVNFSAAARFKSDSFLRSWLV